MREQQLHFFPWLGSLAARAKWLPSKTEPYNINLLIENNKVSCHKAKGPFYELFMSKKLTIIFALLLIASLIKHNFAYAMTGKSS